MHCDAWQSAGLNNTNPYVSMLVGGDSTEDNWQWVWMLFCFDLWIRKGHELQETSNFWKTVWLPLFSHNWRSQFCILKEAANGSHARLVPLKLSPMVSSNHLRHWWSATVFASKVLGEATEQQPLPRSGEEISCFRLHVVPVRLDCSVTWPNRQFWRFGKDHVCCHKTAGGLRGSGLAFYTLSQVLWGKVPAFCKYKVAHNPKLISSGNKIKSQSDFTLSRFLLNIQGHLPEKQNASPNLVVNSKMGIFELTTRNNLPLTEEKETFKKNPHNCDCFTSLRNQGEGEKI